MYFIPARISPTSTHAQYIYVNSLLLFQNFAHSSFYSYKVLIIQVVAHSRFLAFKLVCIKAFAHSIFCLLNILIIQDFAHSSFCYFKFLLSFLQSIHYCSSVFVVEFRLNCCFCVFAVYFLCFVTYEHILYFFVE